MEAQHYLRLCLCLTLDHDDIFSHLHGQRWYVPSRRALVTVNQATAPNLLSNPGFETGSLSPWWVYGGSLATGNAHTGTYSATAGAGAGVFYELGGLIPNTTYTLSGWIKVISGTNALVGVKNYGNPEKSAPITTPTYSQGVLTFTTGASNTSAEIYGWSDTGTFYMDDYSVTQNATATSPAPTATLSASPTSITSGQSNTLTWSSTNATSCTGNGFSTGGATSGSISVSPTATATYSVTCTGTGGTSAPASATVTVTAAGDTTPPSVPTGLTGTAVSATKINLSWNASTDNVGVTGYHVYRNGLRVATITTTSYANTGLATSTAYTFAVDAFDARQRLGQDEYHLRLHPNAALRYRCTGQGDGQRQRQEPPRRRVSSALSRQVLSARSSADQPRRAAPGGMSTSTRRATAGRSRVIYRLRCSDHTGS